MLIYYKYTCAYYVYLYKIASSVDTESNFLDYYIIDILKAFILAASSLLFNFCKNCTNAFVNPKSKVSLPCYLIFSQKGKVYSLEIQSIYITAFIRYLPEQKHLTEYCALYWSSKKMWHTYFQMLKSIFIFDRNMKWQGWHEWSFYHPQVTSAFYKLPT